MRLHPYQVAYYNAIVGGAGGASERYEGDYWLSSYTEAVRWIQREVEAREVGGATVLLGGHNLLYSPAALGTPNLRFVEFFELGEQVTQPQVSARVPRLESNSTLIGAHGLLRVLLGFEHYSE